MAGAFETLTAGLEIKPVRERKPLPTNCKNCAGPLEDLKAGCCAYCGTRYIDARDLVPRLLPDEAAHAARVKYQMQQDLYRTQLRQMQAMQNNPLGVSSLGGVGGLFGQRFTGLW